MTDKIIIHSIDEAKSVDLSQVDDFSAFQIADYITRQQACQIKTIIEERLKSKELEDLDAELDFDHIQGGLE